jgi:UDP-N-acetylmuramyl pentapeptide phosphotransferase/UDP-N-acetylglucosamine-1-phosphate transferase
MFDGINLQTILYSTLLLVANLILMGDIIFVFYLLPIIICVAALNYKNKLFLGDNGTLLIGFILSCFFILNYNNLAIFYADSIFIFMMLPGLEVLRLAVSRILKKRNPFSADRMHIHHLLLKRFSKKLLNFTHICIHIIILVFILNFFYHSLNFVKSGMGSRAMSFDLQIGYVYLILPISFMFMFLVSVELLINLFKKIFN